MKPKPFTVNQKYLTRIIDNAYFIAKIAEEMRKPLEDDMKKKIHAKIIELHWEQDKYICNLTHKQPKGL